MLVMARPSIEALDEVAGNQQRFAIGPLDPGFGYSIGNSIRRTLLSSIPGAAVTQVRFYDALHEFDTIDGVAEDVTDIILNLKDLVLEMKSNGPITLRLDVGGPKVVTAGDIDPNPEVEVRNKGLILANLNAKGRLAIDMTVQRGRGYQSADRNSTSATIGIIPVDSIYSPVRRVAFSVEPTRVGHSTDFDKLILEVETDGSVSPREALASAGSTLRSLMQLIEEMSGQPRGLQLDEAIQMSSIGPDMNLSIDALDLSERPRNCLKRAQVHTIRELLDRSEMDLLAITNFGQKSLDEVIARLDERGLTLMAQV